MITVLKKDNSEILVLSSKNENIDVGKIRTTYQTIKRINKGKTNPLNIVIRSLEDLQFTVDAKRLFDRIAIQNSGIA